VRRSSVSRPQTVPAFGLRVGDYYRNIDGRTVKIATSLFVPLYSAPRCMVNLQVIMADKSNPLGRDKDFLPGGQIDGAYGVIPGARNRIAICEGYATGAAIALATGRYVALAMSAGNIMSIAVMVRGRCPDVDVVVCADNDAWTVKRFASGDVAWNPGVEFGGAAADAIGARLAVPRFVTAVRGQTDFNDLMIAEGKDIVRRQIEGGE
jgi:putative DNA primase/helicase